MKDDWLWLVFMAACMVWGLGFALVFGIGEVAVSWVRRLEQWLERSVQREETEEEEIERREREHRH